MSQKLKVRIVRDLEEDGKIDQKSILLLPSSSSPSHHVTDENPSERAWCFTHYSVGVVPNFDGDHMKYQVYQLETCPTTGRIHWQGYVEMKHTIRRKAMMKMLGNCWCDIRKGTRDQARAYCMDRKKKGVVLESPVFEFGTWGKGQGNRTDIDQAVACKSVAEIKAKYPAIYVRYFKGFEKLFLPDASRDWEMKIDVFWGPTHSGKTHVARQLMKDSPTYWKMPGKWFDGYTGQENVIWDDFNYMHKDLNDKFMLRLFDKYPLIVEPKGSTVNFVAKWIILTCDSHPRDWTYNEKDQAQLMRRINRIVEFKPDPDRKAPAPEEMVYSKGSFVKCTPIMGPIPKSPEMSATQDDLSDSFFRPNICDTISAIQQLSVMANSQISKDP